MPHPSPPSLLVLHALRLKGFADEAAVAAASGLDAGAAADQLRRLADDGLVTRRDGRVSGWALTPAGRAEHQHGVHTELAVSGRRAEIQRAYRRFMTLNGELLALCTASQLKEAAEDEVVERLSAVHVGVQPVCAALAAVLARYGTYAPRLAHAHERVAAGEIDWLTRPLMDSYHTVWFELHEDLLVTLGLERKEGTG